jgi:G:T/U-mismatch repair DNA glycosylase
MTTTASLLELAKKAIESTDNAFWAQDTFLNKATATPSPTLSADAVPVEWHPLIPFLPKNTRVLFLGSFPPPRKRWCMDFFYPNFINDHWRIEGLAFYDDAQHFLLPGAKTFDLSSIVPHLKQYGIGFFDAAIAVRRLADNASDKFLEVVEATDILAMTDSLPELKAIIATGEKATETIALALSMKDDKGKVTLPKVGTFTSSPIRDIELYRLPSSSRAYPMSLTKKAEAYQAMFRRYV